MNHRNETLYRALKAYLPVAIDFVVARATEQALPSEPDEDEFFYAQLTSAEALAVLPEYQHCISSLLTDEKIAGQLDVLVGTNSGKSRSPTAPQLMNQLINMGVCRGEYLFDAERFEREYTVFEDAFYSDYIMYDVIAPLQNLLVEGSLKLSDDLEISPLKDEDINPDGASKGKLNRYKGHRGRPCAVRSRCRLPKVVGDDIPIDLDKDKEDSETQARINERIEEVVNALRLFEVETVYHVTILYRTSKWLYGGDEIFPNKVQGDALLLYDRDEMWLKAFGAFWKALQSENVKRRQFLGLAIRRFGYAHERHRVEDKIIDLLIAAEALFLSDSGNESYRGELQYRLALRAGFFIGADTVARKAIYQHMRNAYKIRSTIVHGGSPRMPKRENDSPVNLEEFVGMTQVYIRFALRKLINLALHAQPGDELVDWDELIFNESSRTEKNQCVDGTSEQL